MIVNISIKNQSVNRFRGCDRGVPPGGVIQGVPGGFLSMDQSKPFPSFPVSSENGQGPGAAKRSVSCSASLAPFEEETVYGKKQMISEQWAGFLKRYEWDHYSHFTFRPNTRVVGLNRRGVSFIHPEAAGKALKRLVYGLNEKIFGKRFYKRPYEGIIVAAAMERQKSGNPHFHALMGNIPSDIRRMGIVDQWYKSQGIARVYEYKKDMGAEEYISKLCYLFKDGKLEIDLLGPLGEGDKVGPLFV